MSASGAGAVVVKPINENPAASRQLDIADYVFLDDEWSPVAAELAGTSAALWAAAGISDSGFG